MRWDDESDVVVIGAGVTAAAVCNVLRHSSVGDICVLEKGALWDSDNESLPTEADQRRGLGAAPDALDPVLPLQTEGRITDVAKWWQPRLAGGGSVLWYGQLSRFAESDFAGGPNRPPWPIELEDLEEGYAAAEAMLSPFGSSYGMDAAAYAQCETRTWVERPSAHFERELIDRLNVHGLRPYVAKSALGGRAWDQLPYDPLTGAPTGRPPLQSRRTPLAALRQVVASDCRFRVQTRTACRRLVVEAGTVRGVETCRIDERGERQVLTIRARFVVLAAGPLETCRVLLASDLVGNEVVGKGITITLERVAYCTSHIKRSHRAFDRAAGTFGGVVVKDFYAGHSMFGGRKAGKFVLYDAIAAELPGSYSRNTGLTGDALAQHLHDVRDRYVFKLSFKGESCPSADKRITLTSRTDAFGARVAQLHYDPHPDDRLVQAQLPAVIHKIFAAVGAGEVNVRPEPVGSALVSAHHHGGVIMGNSPAAPAAPNGALRVADNVVVADASTFPTSGGTNASLTAMANAHRIATDLLTRL